MYRRIFAGQRFVNVAFGFGISLGILFCIGKAQTEQLSNNYVKDLRIESKATRRAAIAGDSVYLLPLGSTSIDEYSMTDGSTQRLNIGSNGVIQLMRTVEDFMLDPTGNLHALAFVMPMKESSIIRYDRAAARYSYIPLSKRIYAYRLDMDSQGNYYLLGFEPGLGESLAKGMSVPQTLNLVHKYSFDGRYIASFLRIGSPTSIDEFRDLLSSVAGVGRSNFIVLPHGEVYYYHHDMKVVPWNSPGTVYCAGEQNPGVTINPAKSQNLWLAGIHKYRDRIAYEWAEREAFTSKRVTREDGTDIAAVALGGRIIALKDERAAILRPGKDSLSLSLTSLISR